MPFQVSLSHLKSKSDIFPKLLQFMPFQAIYSKSDIFPNFLQFMQLQVMPLQHDTRALYIDFTSMHVSNTIIFGNIMKSWSH